MTDWLLGLVPQYGLGLLAVCTFLSCLALPIPASILMLAAGGFVASGDLALIPTLLSALLGAVAGDQIGFLVGRRGGAGLMGWLNREPLRAKLIARARDLMDRRGMAGIFLTRWLFSPVGPYANFVAGAIGYGWLRFCVAAAVGEAVWVCLYVGLGRSFAGNLEAASAFAGSILGVLAGVAAMIGLGLWLRASMRAERDTE